MAFQVGFIHHIYAEVIKHGIHFGRIRVVAGAESVDVVLFEHQHVFQHGAGVDGTSVKRVGVVSVCSFEEYFFTVYVDEFADLLYMTEAVFS